MILNNLLNLEKGLIQTIYLNMQTIIMYTGLIQIIQNQFTLVSVLRHMHPSKNNFKLALPDQAKINFIGNSPFVPKYVAIDAFRSPGEQGSVNHHQLPSGHNCVKGLKHSDNLCFSLINRFNELSMSTMQAFSSYLPLL